MKFCGIYFHSVEMSSLNKASDLFIQIFDFIPYLSECYDFEKVCLYVSCLFSQVITHKLCFIRSESNDRF